MNQLVIITEESAEDLKQQLARLYREHPDGWHIELSNTEAQFEWEE